LVFHCAHPTRAFLSRALRAHRRSSASSMDFSPSPKGVGELSFTARVERCLPFYMILPSSLVSRFWNGTRGGPTAAVERAHSDRARSGSKGAAWVSFPPSCAFREQEGGSGYPRSPFTEPKSIAMIPPNSGTLGVILIA